MRYEHKIERSAEYLRLAIPLMSKQAAALHPMSYAIWYEYVSGMNAALKQEIDKTIRETNGNGLTEETTHQLYQKYIAEIDNETAKRVGSELRAIVAEIQQSAKTTGGQALEYDSALQRCSQRLDDTLDVSTLQTTVHDVLHATRNMKESIEGLKADLVQNSLEVEKLQQELQQTKKEVLTDALTGLPNRRALDEAIDMCLGEIHNGKIGPCIIMIDIDHFKRVNDTYGHVFGDRVIRAVAQTLKAKVKGQDVVARYGGEEFALLLPETNLAGAKAVAEQVRFAIENSRIRRADREEAIGNITVSAGVAIYEHGESATDWIARADVALYASKSGGRNRVTIADQN